MRQSQIGHLVDEATSKHLLQVAPPPNATHYALVGIIVALWALILQIIRRSGGLRRYVDVVSDQLTVK